LPEIVDGAQRDHDPAVGVGGVVTEAGSFTIAHFVCGGCRGRARTADSHKNFRAAAETVFGRRFSIARKHVASRPRVMGIRCGVNVRDAGGTPPPISVRALVIFADVRSVF
jgi:hypothetical protein